MTTKEKIAVPLEGMPSVVVLNNGDRMKRSTAKAQGWKIYGEPDATALDDANAATLKAHKAWRSSVLALPEARERESAAVEIVTTHTADTMSVASARAFLRGLPTEQTTQEEITTMTTDTNPERAARLAKSTAVWLLSISSGDTGKPAGQAHRPRSRAALRWQAWIRRSFVGCQRSG
jgi:hypothetical protein